MTDEQMLSELIELAVKNGYKHIVFRPNEHIVSLLVGDVYAVMGLLFSHSFAKAVWGEEIDSEYVCPHCENDWVVKGRPDWQYHLQQLAITPEQDRIKYAWNNRREE